MVEALAEFHLLVVAARLGAVEEGEAGWLVTRLLSQTEQAPGKDGQAIARLCRQDQFDLLLQVGLFGLGLLRQSDLPSLRELLLKSFPLLLVAGRRIRNRQPIDFAVEGDPLQILTEIDPLPSRRGL